MNVTKIRKRKIKKGWQEKMEGGKQRGKGMAEKN